MSIISIAIWVVSSIFTMKLLEATGYPYKIAAWITGWCDAALARGVHERNAEIAAWVGLGCNVIAFFIAFFTLFNRPDSLSDTYAMMDWLGWPFYLFALISSVCSIYNHWVVTSAYCRGFHESSTGLCILGLFFQFVVLIILGNKFNSRMFDLASARNEPSVHHPVTYDIFGNPVNGQPSQYPYGQPNPYAQQAYGQQPDPYAQPNPYAQPAAYGQPDQYAQQPSSFWQQPDPYAQQNPYGQPEYTPNAEFQPDTASVAEHNDGSATESAHDDGNSGYPANPNNPTA
ncbi:MAG: hypothetical protein PUF97_00350 [Bifidobacteriaceae bacterium]|nr:hypothetical protein [Bifidobacteriaceae bacterium]